MRALAALSLFLAGCGATSADNNQAYLGADEQIAFREDATAHIWRQVEWCPLTQDPQLRSLYEPVERRSQAFMAAKSRTELEEEYAKAKKLWEEEFGDILVECADPVGLDERAIVSEDVTAYEGLMTDLEAWLALVNSRAREAA